jgi:hypothetical protein
MQLEAALVGGLCHFWWKVIWTHSQTMADCPAFLCKKTLEELKNEAFAQLERRGYEVRGKTPAQIRQILRRRPAKPKSIVIRPR